MAPPMAPRKYTAKNDIVPSNVSISRPMSHNDAFVATTCPNPKSAKAVDGNRHHSFCVFTASANKAKVLKKNPPSAFAPVFTATKSAAKKIKCKTAKRSAAVGSSVGTLYMADNGEKNGLQYFVTPSARSYFGFVIVFIPNRIGLSFSSSFTSSSFTSSSFGVVFFDPPASIPRSASKLDNASSVLEEDDFFCPPPPPPPPPFGTSSKSPLSFADAEDKMSLARRRRRDAR